MSSTVPASATQNLIKRRPGTTFNDFSKYYRETHGRIAMPFFMENGILAYYAQVGATPTPPAVGLDKHLVTVKAFAVSLMGVY